ncbi:MAG TPA: hypothetical protein VFQ61_37100 [Polyangiaceae bacterium]|nr:hypothetical protein [Polyangiaceae bacterium]
MRVSSSRVTQATFVATLTLFACSGVDSDPFNPGAGSSGAPTVPNGGGSGGSNAAGGASSTGSGGMISSAGSLAGGTSGALSTGMGGINPGSSLGGASSGRGGETSSGGVTSGAGQANGGSTLNGGSGPTSGGRSSGEGASSQGGRAASGASGIGGQTNASGAPSAGGGSGGGAGGSTGPGGVTCPFHGNITYTLAKSANPTAVEQDAYTRIAAALDKAIQYYNCYTDITKKLNVSYVPSVQTADGNINGSMRFGSNTTYMDYRTAMHEIGHTVGVGQASNWGSFVTADKIFTGQNANAELKAIDASLDAPSGDGKVHADNQHFWPYGLNQQNEVKSEADLLFHCRMVMAIRKDLGLK